jgi:hypothetical protein
VLVSGSQHGEGTDGSSGGSEPDSEQEASSSSEELLERKRSRAVRVPRVALTGEARHHSPSNNKNE